MVSFWVTCSVLAMGTVSTQISQEKKATTVTRKIFHVLSLLVFVPGIVLKPCTIYLASGVAFAVLLTLDVRHYLINDQPGLTTRANERNYCAIIDVESLLQLPL